MKKSLFIILTLIITLLIIFSFIKKDQYVVLVSMDAFRWDYSDIYNTPVLDAIEAEGVHAKSLIPVYPSKTFPNHYTLATGLYPDKHGIISNTFWDDELQYLYRIGDRDAVENGDFYGGEPVWTTVEKNGMLSASMFWVGSEAPINGHQPKYWNSYDESVLFEARVDSVLHWLSLPKKQRPQFITLYFQEPDGISHNFGPVSHETDSVVRYLDGILGNLKERIEDLNIGKRINLVIVSDHGMAEVDSSRVINLTDYIPGNLIEHYTGGNPSILVDPLDEYLDSVELLLNRIPHVKAWSAESMPEHYNYGKNPRFPGLVAEADSSWSIIASDRPGYSMRSKGAHGYDPANTDMHGIFYALGPAFKKGYYTHSLHNTDIYNIICHILDLEPADNDGNPERIKDIFR